MQQTILQGQNGMVDGKTTRSSDSGYRLNVALVYEDEATRRWAGQVRERMAEEAGSESLRRTEVCLDKLKNRRTFADSVAALAQADAIVVSLYERERLPPVFYLWVNLWLQERSGRPGVLVALVVPPNDLVSSANETRRYLHAVASQGRLELLVQEFNPPIGVIRGPRDQTPHLAKAA